MYSMTCIDSSHPVGDCVAAHFHVISFYTNYHANAKELYAAGGYRQHGVVCGVLATYGPLICFSAGSYSKDALDVVGGSP